MKKLSNNLYEKICSFENLHLAYLKARKGKRYKSDILEFSHNPEERLLKLREELLCQSYRHGGYREFVVHDTKKRCIKAAPFRDRIVHHALCNVIEPIFDNGFIYDSYACRKGKGVHKAVRRLTRFLCLAHRQNRNTEKAVLADTLGEGENTKELTRNREPYVLKCDIAKYFDNIDHSLLTSLIKKKISDKKAIRLSNMIIESTNKDIGKGIPIGNLTSQLFANIYLNELDQFVKHMLRKKHYIRYMDDFIILCDDKRELARAKTLIGAFLREELLLELHQRKSVVHPTRKGIDFLGYMVFEGHTLLRKSTVKRFIKRTRVYKKRLSRGLMSKEKFDRSLQSWLSYAKFGNTDYLRKNLQAKVLINLTTNPCFKKS